MSAATVETQIDLKSKSKDRKKVKKSSPRDQPLSPRQEKGDRSKGSLSENGELTDDMLKYGRNISGAISPTDSISSIHDAQYYNDRIRALESEKLSIMIEHNSLMKEFNRMMETHMEEVRNLKESNMQYEQEIADLKDLSVFLDDDRRKCRRLAKEWQRFGRHTISVMRSEVQGYQEKVRQLENKQSELIKENSELRDLCVYLDNQRSGVNGTDGDISSPLNYIICQECSSLKKDQGETPRHGHGLMKSSMRNDYTADQVLDLQNQILQLEKEKDSLHKLLMYGGKSRRDKKRVSFSVPTDEEYDSSSTTSEVDRLDFPPSFGGSNESFNTILEGSLSSNGILRNGAFPGLSNSHPKLSDISPRNSDLNRLHHPHGMLPLSEVEVNDIRAKLSRTSSGETSLSENDINMLKRMCNISKIGQSTRRDSNASISSLNNSFDQSPLCPPPPINGVPLYNGSGNIEKAKTESNKENKMSDEVPKEVQKGKVPLPSYDEVLQWNQGNTEETEQKKELDSTLTKEDVASGS